MALAATLLLGGTVGTWGMGRTPATAAPPAASSPQHANELSPADLVNRPDRWPAEVRVTEDLDFGGGFVVSPGTTGQMMGFDGRQVMLLLASGDGVAVDVGQTDLLESANAQWASLTADQRAIDAASIWPETVTLNEAVDYEDGISVPAGTEWFLVRAHRGGIHVYEPRHKRQFTTSLDRTDLIARARKLAVTPTEERLARVPAALSGKLVDADGTGIDAASLGDAEVYALYYAAGWCGNCTAFTPDVVKAIDAAQAEHPGLRVVLVSADEEPAKMLTYMKENGFDFPAVPHADLVESPLLHGLYGGGVPQVVILDRHGKVYASSTDMPRAQVLQTLPQALEAEARTAAGRAD